MMILLTPHLKTVLTECCHNKIIIALRPYWQEELLFIINAIRMNDAIEDKLYDTIEFKRML